MNRLEYTLYIVGFDIFILFYSKIKWVDDYHKKTEELVGAELKKQGKTEEREWLLRQTKPIKIVNSNSVTLTNSITLIIFSVIVFQIFL